MHPRRLFLVAIGLLAAALGLGWIARTNTDLPPVGELAREAREIYLPAAAGETGHSDWPLHDPAAGAHAWKLLWLSLNGQWDARLLAVASLALQVLALGALFTLLARCLGWRGLGALAVGFLVFTGFSPIAPRPVESAAWSAGLVALSLLHLGLMKETRGRPRVWWWVGLACGLLNVATAMAGIVSAAALVVWGILAGCRDRTAWRRQRSMLVANGGLVALGMALAVVRRHGADSGEPFFSAFRAMLSWPSANPVCAVVVWAPGLFAIARWMRRRSDDPALATLALLSLWSWGLVAALATRGMRADGTAAEVLTASLLVNAACLAALPVEGWRWPTRNLVLISVWCIVAGNALLDPAPARIPARAGPEDEAPLTVALRRASFDGDAGPLRRTGDLTEGDVAELMRLLRDPGLRRILPGSIRPPLAVEPENAAAGAFRANAAPPISGRDELPVFGTWAPSGPAATGEFVSQPLRTKSSLVQIRVAGDLRPPATSLALRTADGNEIAPLEGAFEADSRWKRVNFPAPSGPFRIVARDASPGLWLAFTAPQEVGRLSWLAGKLTRSWAWWLAGGLAFFLGAAALGWLHLNATLFIPADPTKAWRLPPRGGSRQAFVKRPTQRLMSWCLNWAASAGRVAGPAGDSALHPVGGRGIDWRVVPWLAVFAYGAFYSNHLDPTAGPNDSGGYLNSAKLLVQGHLTAAPRMVFGPAAGETDISPYLPITFVATKGGRMAPTYPVGFPLEIWAIARFTSLQNAVPALILLQLILGVVFTRRLARSMGLPNGWAWLAAGTIGLSPVYLFQALQPLSDGPALVWVTAAVSWAWTSREKPWHAVLAGLATALAVLIRPSNLLCVVPVLVCLIGAWRQLLWWMLAGLPGAIWQMAYSHKLYGSWLTTGYGDVSTGFALHFAPLTIKSYALWLPALLTPVIWLGVFAPFLRSIPLRARLVLTSWAAVFILFYTFYWCTYDNWYNMRFVLPAAPAMVVLSLFVLWRGSERAGLALFAPGSLWRSTMPSVALVALLFGWLVKDGVERRVLYWMQSNRVHAVGALWARDHFPANAVVFARHATGSLMYYSDVLFVRTDTPQARSLAFFERIARTGRPIYALTYHWERRGYRWETGPGDGYPDLPGTWKQLAMLGGGQIYAWAWHAPIFNAAKPALNMAAP